MSALFGMQINQVMLLFGVGLIAFVLINRLRRGAGQARSLSRGGRSWRNEGRSERTVNGAREVIGSARLRSARAPIEHESWEVDMHGLAREIKAEIDTRMQALVSLIQQADQARNQLDAALARSQSHGALSADDFRVVHPVENRPHRRAVPSTRTANFTAAVSAGSDLGEDPRFERVYALADAGFSATKIANQIGSQVGEVELILSLRAV